MRKTVFSMALITLAIATVGCAISDYDGIPDHKTTGESKLFATEIAFSGFGADVDGTYAYTVKYDNSLGSGNVTINSYRNPIFSSFTREGLIDQDGDDVQGSGGTLGGKFLPQFVSVDSAPDCQFDDNLTQDKSTLGPGVFLCISGFQEEIDKDFELHAAFSGIGDLLNQIWSGSLQGDFTLELTGLTVDGVAVPVDTFSIGAGALANRPGRFTITNQPSTASLIQAILDNTQHMAPVDLGLTFAGGLTFHLPAGMKIAFDHDVLMSLP